MTFLRIPNVLFLILSVTMSVGAQVYRVGFTEMQYSVNEGETSVEVCVTLISPIESIGNVEIDLEVTSNGLMSNATADTLNLFGEYVDSPGCDYKPTTVRFGQIYQRPITEATRTVCYDHLLCVDDIEVEGNEFFELSIVDKSSSDVNVEIDATFGITSVVIFDNDAIPGVECPQLQDPANGAVSQPNNVATYTCDPGFVLVGSETQMCMTDGTWSGQPPTCSEISCPNLDNPDNGFVTLDGTSLGSIAMYSCNTGFKLDGPETLTCANDGTWSGQPPTCSEICPELMVPDEGMIMIDGTIATYTCNDRFYVSGNDFRTCDFDTGVWSGSDPVCQLFCLLLPPLANGRVSSGQNSEEGDVARYSCDSGFELIGNTIQTCQANGTWSDMAPNCQRIVMCPALPNPTNGVVSHGMDVLDLANYSCDDGFELIGEDMRTCQADGAWSGSAPTCQLIGDEIIVNDTIIGDPLFTVTLPDISEYMCYEVRGEAGAHLNLISDTCTSVNALYGPVPDNPTLNRMSEIGIRAGKTSESGSDCDLIKISIDTCSATINNDNIILMADSGDISIRRFGNRWRVAVPNCQRLGVVMWITCAGSMLRFDIARGSGLASSSHGLLGQFWNIPINVVDIDGKPYIEIEGYRLVPAFEYDLTWDHSTKTCYYVGNKQGGPEKTQDPTESVIEGRVIDYKTGSLFGIEFEYTKFDNSICGS